MSVLQAAVDAVDPVDVGMPHRSRIGLVVDVDPIAAGFFGGVAGGVGGAQDALHALTISIDRDQADADADAKAAAVPCETQIVDRIEHGIGHALGLVDVAALQQHAEFVAAEAGERIALAHDPLQNPAQLA
jgi:hypothetical protein